MDGRTAISGATGKLQGMGSSQKIAVLLLTVALVVTLYYSVSFLQQANYTPLFTQVDPQEAGPIIDKLDSMKVPYQLSQGGTTIAVPRNKVYEARIQLASSGVLMGGGIGFELFDRNKLGITEFEQQINYHRALQEELRRTIVQLDAVEQARVHLVIPEKTIFAEEQRPPSASIALKVRASGNLSSDQVKGIVALVAGSVEGLNPEHIHVIDTRGRVLSENMGADSLSGTALSQLEIRRAYEKELEKRVLSLLSPILGPNKAVVMVTADLDFRQRQSVLNMPTGDREVVSEYQLREQTQSTSGGGAGGIPGTDSNLDSDLPTYPTQDSGTGETGQSYSREERTTNYQVGTLVETSVQPPGQVIRLSTSVVVDGPVTASVAGQVQDMVSVALGLNTERGDQVLVSSMTFDTTTQLELEEDLAAVEAASREQARAEMVKNLIIGGALLLLIIVLFIGILLMARRQKPVMSRVGGTPGAAVSATAAAVAQEPEVDLSPDQTRARHLAKDKPEEVAQIIKLWLAEK